MSSASINATRSVLQILIYAQYVPVTTPAKRMFCQSRNESRLQPGRYSSPLLSRATKSMCDKDRFTHISRVQVSVNCSVVIWSQHLTPGKVGV
jgi:hypothetical protein